MALYFFDSSALVKRYVHEHGSVWVRETTASPRGHLIHISLFISFAIFHPCGVFNPMKMPRQPQLQ